MEQEPRPHQPDYYGQHFKRARLEAARSLNNEFAERAEAAKAIGVSDSYLKKIESGDRRPSFDMLQAMARAYNRLEGDLLPSMAPRGAEADRILGPLLTIPEPMRAMFITQMEAFARTLSTGMAMAALTAQPELIKDVANSGASRNAVDAGNQSDQSWNPVTRRVT